jgi:prepilin-type processing-associated H-X9-DG protein
LHSDIIESLAASGDLTKPRKDCGLTWAVGFFHIQVAKKSYQCPHCPKGSCPREVSPKHIKDGLAHTMMWFEDGGRPLKYVGKVRDSGTVDGGRWADNANWWIQHNNKGSQIFNINNSNEIYSFHPGGANFAYGDGSVRFHDQMISAEAFVSLFTRAGADSVDAKEF